MFKLETVIHYRFPEHLEEYTLDLKYRFGLVWECKEWKLRYAVDKWCKENISGTIYVNTANSPDSRLGLYHMPFLTFKNKEDELKYILRWFGTTEKLDEENIDLYHTNK